MGRVNDRQAEIWAALTRHQFDPPGAQTLFIDKLIRETGWTRGYAERVTLEYRRYLLIAATAGHGVSPSEAVDQAWHTHLLYTRNYWKLCREVLGFEFHHEPAIGTADDRGKLDDWYTRTRRSYEDIFKTAPPADIWPAKPKTGVFRRIDTDRNWVIPVPGKGFWIVAALAAGATVGVLLAIKGSWS